MGDRRTRKIQFSRAPGAAPHLRFKPSTRMADQVFAQKLILSCLLIIRGVSREANVDGKIERF